MQYEMLAGRHPIREASTFETLNAVLTADPPDLATVNPRVPPALARITMRLLRKDPDARFQSASDLVWALEQAGGTEPFTARAPAAGPGASAPTDAAAARGFWRQPASGWTAGLAIGALAFVAALLWRPGGVAGDAAAGDGAAADAVRGPTQFTVAVPDGLGLFSAPAVSPDGRHIAFVTRGAAGTRLWVRALAAREAEAVAGTEGAQQPFWSADSRSIGYFARGRIWKLAWPGGAPLDLAPAIQPRGGAWGPDGTILFAPDITMSGLLRVAGEGAVEPMTVVDTASTDTTHWWPVFLPDGVRYLYLLRSMDLDRIGLHAGRRDRALGSPAGPPLLRIDHQPVVAALPGGREAALFVVAGDGVEVRRLDLSTLAIADDAHALHLTVGAASLHHAATISASPGVLAFTETPIPFGTRMETFSRTGVFERDDGEFGVHNWPRVSPDGRLVAMQRVDLRRNNADIFVSDLQRNTRARISSAVQPDIQPVWSPDGRQLAFTTGNLPGRTNGDRVISIAAADGTGVVRTVPCPPKTYCEPSDWSQDGRRLLINVYEDRDWDIWIVTLDGSPAPAPLLADAHSERDARFSPDARWVAYVSEESTQPTVVVRSIDGPARRFEISGAGGAQPVWRRDGKELFFVDPTGALRAVAVRWPADGTPAFGLPKPVEVPRVGFGHWGTQYDVSLDGTRFYIMRTNPAPLPREIRVITGWSELLR
jgi:hypothetical protein